jgi:hypothetical protein
MKRFFTILTSRLSKTRMYLLILLAWVAVLVTSPRMALLAIDGFCQPDNRAHMTNTVRPIPFRAARSAAGDYPLPAGATGSPEVVGWRSLLPRLSSFTLPPSFQERGRRGIR